MTISNTRIEVLQQELNVRGYSVQKYERSYKRFREPSKPIDYSIQYLDLGGITATVYKCPCGRCKKQNYLLTWDGIQKAKWYGEGACPYTLAIRFAKLSLMEGREMDYNITNKLVERSKNGVL